MTKDTAFELLGNDHTITRYAFDDCENDEHVPIFESPTGPVTLYEYRSRGIYFGLKDEKYVDEINYSSEPPGRKFSRCDRSR
jgi:hypothetical protein